MGCTALADPSQVGRGLPVRDTHGGKDHHEGLVLLPTTHAGVLENEADDLIGGQSRTGKDGQFLSPDEGVEGVHGGQSRFNEELRPLAGDRVEG